MNDSDPVAKFVDAMAANLTALITARGFSLDPATSALFVHAGELSAQNISDPGQLTMPVLMFAVGEIAHDLLGHQGIDDFKLIAEVLVPDPEQRQNMRKGGFADGTFASPSTPPTPAVSPAVQNLLIEASRLVQPFGILKLNHIVAAFETLPADLLNGLIVEFGINPQRLKRLIEMQNGRVQLEGAHEFDASLQSGNVISLGAENAEFQDFVEATVKRAEDSSVPPPQVRREEVHTNLSLDDPEMEQDAFGRTVLAIGLARRLHRIWCLANRIEFPAKAVDQATDAPSRSVRQWIDSVSSTMLLRAYRARRAAERSEAEYDHSRSSFVLHIDAPWGGGKTTFAHFIASTLNPLPFGQAPAEFLRQRYAGVDLGGIFLEDPPGAETENERVEQQDPASRRPWIIVNFNAWQVEHCQPPWWVFYETIRQQCFMAIKRQGSKPWSPDSPANGRSSGLGATILNSFGWLKLWLRELWFRMTAPKIQGPFWTGIFCLAILIALLSIGAWGVKGANGDASASFILKNPIGLLLTGMTGLSFLWALGKAFTEALTPGIDALSEGVGLGKDDPFDRFKRHFQGTLRRLKRPVMVVIDDLDRCNPAFVVDLLRGVQTLLRSPRVVLLILGDREWIENAFEASYSAMKGIELEPEQSLGARFVEKAIQMSFILPRVSNKDQSGYLRRVLLGSKHVKHHETTPQQAASMRMLTNEISSQENLSSLGGREIADRVITTLSSGWPVEDERRLQLEQDVRDNLAINAAVDRRVDEEIFHQLEVLADSFPSNPRQVKRIVNAVTIYYAAALQRPDLNPDAEFRRELTIWIILMNEWPETWKLLVSCPQLIGILREDDWKEAAEKMDADQRPGSVDATITAIGRIMAYPALVSLITGNQRNHQGLSLPRAIILAELTPLHRRNRRLD